MLPTQLLPAVKSALCRLPFGRHRLLSMLEGRLSLDDVITAQLVGRQRMRVHSRDFLHRNLFWFGAYEPAPPKSSCPQ